MLESFLPFAIAFVSLGAFELGTRVRERVHVIMPYKDPVTILLFLIALSPVILSGLGHEIIDPGNVWYLSFVVAFLGCYSLAYIRGELDLVYVNVHTIISERFPAGAQEIRPLVYYWDKKGNQCIQEQGFKEILKSVFLGIRSPLRLDIGLIKRTRPIRIRTVLLPLISLDPIDVVEEKIEENVIKKWIFPFKVRSYSYTSAPSCIDTTQQWLVSAYNQDQLTKELTRKEAQLLESKTSAMSTFYAKSADLLVEMISDRTPGAEIYNDVAERLSPHDERQQRPPRIEEDQQPLKRKGIFRKRAKEVEE